MRRQPHPRVGGIPFAGWIPIETLTASASSTLDFKVGINSTYDAYCFVFTNLLPSADGEDLGFRVSDDTGATFKSGAADYEYNVIEQVSSTEGVAAARNHAGTTRAIWASTVSNASGDGGLHGYLNFFQPDEAAFMFFEGFTVSFDNAATPDQTGCHSIGCYNGGTEVIDAVRLYPLSGNFTSGSAALYGLAK